MTDDGLAVFYRRYSACCNEHRVEDLAQFVSGEVAIDGVVRGRDAYAEELRVVIRAFPDYRWQLRRLVVDPPWIAAHLIDTGTHCGPFFGVPATGRTVSIPEFASTASTPTASPRCGAAPSACTSYSKSASRDRG